MKISRLIARTFRLPPARSVALPLAGGAVSDRKQPIAMVIQIDTDEKITGLGFGCLVDGGSSLISAVADDLSPLLIGEDPTNHERLWAKSRTLENPAAHRAYSIIDIALWDLKGKIANLPLWRLLGGARESAKTFTAETAPAHLSADDAITIARASMAKGLKGVRIGVRGVDPELESRKIVTVRDAIGEDVWFAVTVESRYDYETALPMARFLEEEVGADCFEDPLADDDSIGYAQLVSRTDTPLATGGRYNSPEQFVRLLELRTPVTLRPDVVRIGGLTPWLKVAVMAELRRRPIVPRLLPEIGVHLACGLPGVQAVEYSPILQHIFQQRPALANGELAPPTGPGLGLDLNEENLAKDQIAIATIIK
jgi:L-alanine-DL-glutamate epimerase-like enolase superfamily enzyme